MRNLSCALLLGVSACGGSTAPSVLQLELGTGGPGVFFSITNGDTVSLIHGPQGAQHIWICLRARALSGHTALVDLAATGPSGVVVSAPFYTPLDFAPVSGAPYEQLDGIRLVVPTPEDVLGKTVHLSARITNAAGVAVDARDVRVQWEGA